MGRGIFEASVSDVLPFLSYVSVYLVERTLSHPIRLQTVPLRQSLLYPSSTAVVVHLVTFRTHPESRPPLSGVLSGTEPTTTVKLVDF